MWVTIFHCQDTLLWTGFLDHVRYCSLLFVSLFFVPDRWIGFEPTTTASLTKWMLLKPLAGFVFSALYPNWATIGAWKCRIRTAPLRPWRSVLTHYTTFSLKQPQRESNPCLRSDSPAYLPLYYEAMCSCGLLDPGLCVTGGSLPCHLLHGPEDPGLYFILYIYICFACVLSLRFFTFLVTLSWTMIHKCVHDSECI